MPAIGDLVCDFMDAPDGWPLAEPEVDLVDSATVDGLGAAVGPSRQVPLRVVTLIGCDDEETAFETQAALVALVGSLQTIVNEHGRRFEDAFIAPFDPKGKPRYAARTLITPDGTFPYTVYATWSVVLDLDAGT